MTVAGFVLNLIGVYFLFGFLIGLVFVISGVRKVDPVADSAPLRVRMLFLPGSMALWPVVLHFWRVHKRGQSSES